MQSSFVWGIPIKTLHPGHVSKSSSQRAIEAMDSVSEFISMRASGPVMDEIHQEELLGLIESHGGF